MNTKGIARLLPSIMVLILGASLSACVTLLATNPEIPLRARVGREFSIVIPSNPSTGYRWVLVEASLPDNLANTGTRYVPDNAAVGLAGAGGKSVWTFRAATVVDVVLRFEQYPPAANAEPVATLEFRVIVE
ncbi:MAG: hypothetical protein A2087_12690 [Spirochaetes bacterium GWD1_61_31]|nr:MAG: hypothetical protein A2Y37_05730 [Spirochaetes bacterium GWB1_60_80]OHD34521.1 MAG: hypothetical protein A2004_08850 [Spirochaetes bacterium GWC1_61_12]OHD38124.1 MAG: hypothetical protein A2087_12690 [Spirochaetes bacterium GWD1_61_31]OHD42966.1 MAG: hypothetical protein A2Y35_14150 [Spirochaetes bacterium GWE1_60_18]OHD58691.1 MAG: hypothetical protein A2Y32_02055 [Spirochaetes bacterium GWF1_60_12]HAP44189.1 hypothetical protein [Spirochaetaceae bacterium]